MIQEKIKLHLGCGWRNFGKDWIHIDDGDYSHLDIKCDVSKLDLPDNYADLIYASHVIAYFDRTEIIDVLKEWYRVLKPGGTLRIGTPDFEAMSRLYSKGDIKLEQILGPMYGKMPMDKITIYHKTVYDFNSLSELAYNCGFTDIKIYKWEDTEHSKHDDHSQAYIPHMDKENGTLISLNVEITK
jgi:predicted SAM-dependent methyltransferase